jgi:hypothetical protein
MSFQARGVGGDEDWSCGLIRGIQVGCAVTVVSVYPVCGGLEGTLLCMTVVGSMRTMWSW